MSFGRLYAEEALLSGQALVSDNDCFQLVMQTDGNLVLYHKSDGRPLWSADTYGSGATDVVMQGDGNLVVYDADRSPLWASDTSGNGGSFLAVQDDGNMCIYNSSDPDTAIWSTDTWQSPETIVPPVRDSSRRKKDVLDNLISNDMMTIGGRKKFINGQTEDEDGNDEGGEEDLYASILKAGMFANQNYEELKGQHDEENLFVDPWFPASAVSINIPQFNEAEWKRPKEICDDPQFFSGGASRFDINQGNLGDCWLMVAFGNLTLNKKLFAQVVPLDQSFGDGYAGIFHFRFWQYGKWVDIVIDDLLPVGENGRLVFNKSDESNEFWPALLEKAYAKLHANYNNLRGGQPRDGMVDLSGGVGENCDLKTTTLDIHETMRKAQNLGTLLFCVKDKAAGEVPQEGETLDVDTGLFGGHAYSVTNVVVVQTNDGEDKHLIRVRNPWGNEKEWKGAWSDGSEEWDTIPQEEKDRLEVKDERIGDGEFYISKEDFVKHFHGVDMCHLPPDCMEEGQQTWYEAKMTGSWIAGTNAGGCGKSWDDLALNPQYKIVLEDSEEDSDDRCTCVISLMQKVIRKKGPSGEAPKIPAIGFNIYPLNDDSEFPLTKDFFIQNAKLQSGKSGIKFAREVSARFTLDPGSYVIVPFTYNKDEEGKFLLRVISEKPSSLECGKE